MLIRSGNVGYVNYDYDAIISIDFRVFLSQSTYFGRLLDQMLTK